jgi:hypothetical protein
MESRGARALDRPGHGSAVRVSAGTHNDARIYGIVGKSGSGKGLCVKGEIIKPWKGPILVWSPLEDTDNYTEVIKGVVCKTIVEVVSAIQKGHKRVVMDAGNIAPMGPNVKLNNTQVKAIKTAFDRFCRIAWELPGWMVVIEELSQVTQASWAPPAWKKISTAGRHRGLTVVGVCQNPAQVDKDFFGNCTMLRCYKIGNMSHAKAMADVLFCKKEEILQLERLHYIERDVDNNKNRIGVAKIPKK